MKLAAMSFSDQLKEYESLIESNEARAGFIKDKLDDYQAKATAAAKLHHSVVKEIEALKVSKQQLHMRAVDLAQREAQDAEDAEDAELNAAADAYEAQYFGQQPAASGSPTASTPASHVHQDIHKTIDDKLSATAAALQANLMSAMQNTFQDMMTQLMASQHGQGAAQESQIPHQPGQGLYLPHAAPPAQSQPRRTTANGEQRLGIKEASVKLLSQASTSGATAQAAEQRRLAKEKQLQAARDSSHLDRSTPPPPEAATTQVDPPSPTARTNEAMTAAGVPIINLASEEDL